MRRLMITMAALVFTVGLISYADAEKKLVGHWSFDEGKGLVVKDISGNQKHGKRHAYRGRGTKWVEGYKGKAIQFVGGDPKKRSSSGCVVIPNMGDIDFSTGMTVELWVNIPRIKSNGELVTNTRGDRGKGWRFFVTPGERFCFVSGVGGYKEKVWGVLGAKPKEPIQPGVWYHVAATYDGSVFRVYVDGKEIGASKEGLKLTKGRDALSIGAFNGGYAYGLNGIIDEVKLYNYALTAEEILKAAEADE